MKANTSLLSAAVILFTFINSANAYREVIDLGPGTAYSINDNGQIVGNDGSHACLFDSTGHGRNIILSDDFSSALSINNNGQIVGWIHSFFEPMGGKLACRFDETGAGANISLVDPDSLYIGTDYRESEAVCINDNGQIVGRFVNPLGNNRAYLFDPTGGWANKNLGTLTGYDDSEAYSINNIGQIVGVAYNSSGSPHAFLFDPADSGYNKIDIGSGNAQSINDNSEIVGYEGTWLGNVRAYLFDPSGQGNNICLGNLGDPNYPSLPNGSIAYSINDIGQIVGWSNGCACLFDPTGEGDNISLNKLTDYPPDWLLGCAYSINNNGWIVGEGYHDGSTHAFLLTPEPATLLLFAFGGLILRRKINQK